MKTARVIAILTALVVTGFVVLQATRPKEAAPKWTITAGAATNDSVIVYGGKAFEREKRAVENLREIAYLEGWAHGYTIARGIYSGAYSNSEHATFESTRLRTNFLAKP
jgi:hypothetical protein